MRSQRKLSDQIVSLCLLVLSPVHISDDENAGNEDRQHDVAAVGPDHV